MSAEHASIWVYGTETLSMVMRSYVSVPVTFSVDGRTRFERSIGPLGEVRIALVSPGWHLVSFDTPPLPEVNGRREGARLIAYKLN